MSGIGAIIFYKTLTKQWKLLIMSMCQFLNEWAK